ncbi:MAG: DUF4345 family protein [Planctomycetota bacterium]|jgi:hypothetical protein
MQLAFRGLLLLNGAVFLGTAVWVLAMPLQAAEGLGLALPGAQGVNEFHANFFGLYAALGLYLLWAAGPRFRVSGRHGLLVLALACAGLAGGRIAAFGADAGPQGMQVGFLIWEAITAMLVSGYLLRTRTPS